MLLFWAVEYVTPTQEKFRRPTCDCKQLLRNIGSVTDIIQYMNTSNDSNVLAMSDGSTDLQTLRCFKYMLG